MSGLPAQLTVSRRDGVYVYVSAPRGSVNDAAATIEEDEGTTFVMEQALAESAGLDWSFAAAWLTIDAITSLDDVGLTAAFARALADAGIPCNVLAGLRHDHLLVPVDRADDAIAALSALGP